jgi:Asp-tRNA(Asn)/Glu-tRNA(Gln) amidotransferase A subunit family amidase
MSAKTAVRNSLEQVASLDEQVRAWAFVDPERALAEAELVDARPAGDLTGFTWAAKDVFDTADQPTAYGTELYRGNRPSADASAVALLRRAGAVCIGKTVTAELACSHPGPTTNPHRESHTPGGSSMGSAAAVACAMVDFALGTQTAASIVRPASFCGIFGFKPTFATVSTAGVKAVAPSLDTVGWFARDPALLGSVLEVLTRRRPGPPPMRRAKVAVLRTEAWDMCEDDSKAAVAATAERLADAGAAVEEVGSPDYLAGLSEQHGTVMAYEAARALAYEHTEHRDELSGELVELLDRGLAVDPLAYDAARAQASVGRRLMGDFFARFDAIVTPAVIGEAPPSLETTGDPRFGRTWTMLGLPVVAVPAAVGRTGLPVGVQLVGAPFADHDLLALASRITLDQPGQVTPV